MILLLLLSLHVNVSWKLPQTQTTVELYRASGNGAFVHVTNVVGTKYTDSNVVAGQTYSYKAVTYCKTCRPQTSKFSNVVKIKVP